jgi:chromosome partitioning protein
LDLLGRLRDPIRGGAQRARNRSLLEAAMASAALAASADGEVSFARRHALDGVLDGVDALKTFDVHHAIDLFDSYVRGIQSAPEQGRAKALGALRALAGQEPTARLLARIAAALARAEGEVSDRTRTRVEEICRTLGVSTPALGARARRGNGKGGPGPRVIVLGNEKGGTGKSTTAMHLIVALLGGGRKVGSIDLDGSQGTLTRYIANRESFVKKTGRKIAMPLHRCLESSEAPGRAEARAEEEGLLDQALSAMADCRFVVIDTPGSNTHLARLGHAQAHSLITPLNDSFLDIDVLARVDRDRRAVLEPSRYCRMVLEEIERRKTTGTMPLDWIVMRNRLAHIDSRNSREIAGLLARLSKRLGFRLQPGFSERVVFRELFYRGLTLLDLPADLGEARANARHAHALGEVRDLVEALALNEAAAGPALEVPVV